MGARSGAILGTRGRFGAVLGTRGRFGAVLGVWLKGLHEGLARTRRVERLVHHTRGGRPCRGSHRHGRRRERRHVDREHGLVSIRRRLRRQRGRSRQRWRRELQALLQMGPGARAVCRLMDDRGRACLRDRLHGGRQVVSDEAIKRQSRGNPEAIQRQSRGNERHSPARTKSLSPTKLRPVQSSPTPPSFGPTAARTSRCAWSQLLPLPPRGPPYLRQGLWDHH